VGKTSLLESIEYFYCGENRRSGAPNNARIAGRLEGGKDRIVTSASTAGQIFRDRQLEWYGKLSLRGNQLSQSFGIYNFLNTDAAVHLATDDNPADREKDLATLLVGAEAARVWGRIERVIERLPSEIRGLDGQLAASVSKLNAEQSRLKIAQGTPRQSDEIFSQLKANLMQLGWTGELGAKTEVSQQDHVDLSKLESTLRSVLGLPDLPPEVTPQSLEAAISANRSWLERAEKILSEYSRFSDQMKSIDNTQKQSLATQEGLRRLSQYATSGYPGALTGIDQQNAAMARAIQRLGAVDPEKFSGVEFSLERLPLLVLARQASVGEAEASRARGTASQLFDAFKAEHGKVESLAQELRAIARQLIAAAADADTCPLCHTQFAPGELERHMLAAVDPNHAAREKELSEAASAAQRHYETIRDVTRQLSDLREYCRRNEISEDLTPDEVIAHIRQSAQVLESLRSERDSMSDRVAALEKSGFLRNEYEALRTDFTELLNGRTDPSHLEALLNSCESQLAAARSALAPLQEQLEQLRSQRDSLIKEAEFEPGTTIRRLQEGLRRRLANVRSVQESTHSLRSGFRIEATTRLFEVLSTLSAASATQERLRLALQAEMTSDTSMAEARLGLEAAEGQFKRLTASMERFRSAKMALDELQSQHSLELATREALQFNRVEVARIFERIHAPHEFEVSLSGQAPLQRIETKEAIQLGRISSGQRAAFALSLFLALNSRASQAPPIMLIDDPVAHVDDLNTLSFLDYIRDLVTTERRQVFFATADEKLAALFAHKFSFLGSDFHNFPLSRG
jgi:DNA repair protein SbcC/Rad50